MEKQDIRCGACGRKLGEGAYQVLSIKCPRFGTINHLRAESPSTHAAERLTSTEKHHGGINPTR